MRNGGKKQNYLGLQVERKISTYHKTISSTQNTTKMKEEIFRKPDLSERPYNRNQKN